MVVCGGEGLDQPTAALLELHVTHSVLAPMRKTGVA